MDPLLLLDEADEGLPGVGLPVGLPDVPFAPAVLDEALGGHEDPPHPVGGDGGEVDLGAAGEVFHHLGGVAVARGLVDPDGPGPFGVVARRARLGPPAEVEMRRVTKMGVGFRTPALRRG